MTESFKTATYLLACAARGIKPEIKNKIALKELCAVARTQSILPTIYPALREMEWSGEEKQIIDAVEMQSLQMYSFQYARREFMSKLYAQLNELNIPVCLLKGETIAQFYSEPLLRPASDVDIRVADEDVEKTIEVLKQNGYTVDPLEEGEHHYECHHPKHGLLELHIAFCLNKTNAILFKNSMDFNEPYVSVDIPELGRVNMLGYTDGYIYLVNHFIKHFIFAGAGIRHLMDIAFYLENYRDKIDTARVKAAMENIGYYGFYKNIMYICSKYLLSDICGEFASTGEEAASAAEKILTDMENGGVFGHDDKSRSNSYDVYLTRRAEKQGDSLHNYQRSVLERLCPPMKAMKEKYTYLQKLPFLYPVALIHKIIDGINARMRKRRVYGKTDIQGIEKRLSLLNEVGL